MMTPCTAPTAAYTQNTDVKAIGPAWKPVKSTAHLRPSCDIGAFFAPMFSMAGCVGQSLRLAGSVVRYFHPHASRRPLRGKSSDGIPHNYGVPS